MSSVPDEAGAFCVGDRTIRDLLKRQKYDITASKGLRTQTDLPLSLSEAAVAETTLTEEGSRPRSASSVGTCIQSCLSAGSLKALHARAAL